MSALSMILQPTVEPRPKQEVDETIDVQPAKRRKSTPPENNKSSSLEKSANGNKDERKRRWLAGLSHEELLGVAQGAVWQVGGLHSKNCFNCKKEGTLLECYNCPRSYHRRCLDPPIHGNFKIDQPWFCPNCVLLQLDADEPNHQSMSRSGSDQSKPLAKLPPLIIGDVTPLHRSSLPLLPTLASKTAALPSQNRTPLPDAQERPHKRSRYTTLPEHIDEALGLLNRELESAYQSKNVVRDMASKIHVLEQELKIRKGQEVLMAREQEREISPGKEVLESLKREIEGLRNDNRVLREEVERMRDESKRKEGENDKWRRSMKALIDWN